MTMSQQELQAKIEQIKQLGLPYDDKVIHSALANARYNVEAAIDALLHQASAQPQPVQPQVPNPYQQP